MASGKNMSLRSRFHALPRSGQITIFIIVSIILVTMVTLLYFRVERTEKKLGEFTKVTQQWDVPSIQSFVQGCVDKLSTDAVFYFGMVGGRTGFFTEFLDYDEYYKIPYYYHMAVPGRRLMPTKDQVERDILSTFISARLKGCTDGFRSAQGFTIKEGDIRTKATVNQKSVDFTVEYPLEIMKGDQKTTIKDFSSRVPSRLFDMLDIANVIIDREMQDDRVVYWDFLTDVTNRGFNITAHADHYHTIVYRIVDPEFTMYFEPFVFQFANRVRVEG